jgi:hypothetical protein
MTVRTVDRGATALLARLRERARAVEVGVLGAEARAEKEQRPAGPNAKKARRVVTVADVAAWAEFGIGQPRRSWLVDYIETHGPAISERMRIETRAIIEGRRTKAQALGRIGLWIQGQIQQRISDGIAPPNAQATIDRKESSTPLIDTNQLRSSIANRVVS